MRVEYELKNNQRGMSSQSINQFIHNKFTKLRKLFNTRIIKCLRDSDCKYRETADKLRKSKILITFQKNIFGELSSKILFKPSKILITCQKNAFGKLSLKMLLKPSGIPLFSGNSEKRFCLINYAKIRFKIKQTECACLETT